METMQLTLQNLVLGYEGKAILPPLDLSMKKGDFLGIVGPNGSGKTTILKAILGLLHPLSGRVMTAGGTRFGYVPQQEVLDELFPLTARDIVAMARYPLMGMRLRLNSHDREMVENSLERVDLLAIANRPYRELSGGQKQRTLIARALAAEPDILVLDEPTSGMDIIGESAIMGIIEKLNAQGLSIILVTHILNLVARYAGSILLIHGEIFHGTLDEILTEEMLTKAYNSPIRVLTDEHQRKVILAGKDPKG